MTTSPNLPVMNDPALASFHDSWVTVDPIVGCVANCDYCYLGQMKLRGRRPRVRASLAECFIAMEALPGFLATDVPVCIGNYTDMLMGDDNRQYLLDFLTAFSDKYSNRTICVVTKGAISHEFAARLSDSCRELVVFVSQSYSGASTQKVERGPISTVAETLSSIEAIASRSNLRAIHFWRPFLSAFNGPETLPGRIRKLSGAGSSGSVVVGLKLTNNINETSRTMMTVAATPHDVLSVSGDEVFFDKGFQTLVGEARGADYPVLRNTSCGIAIATGSLERLGTRWGATFMSRCVQVGCPPGQRAICDADDPRWPGEPFLARVALDLGLSARPTVDPGSGHVVADEVTEGVLNALTHALRTSVTSSKIRTEKVWPGAVVELRHREDARLLTDLTPGKWLELGESVERAAYRLRGVTGFVTTLSTSTDRRATVFSRFDHVQRVAWLSERLSGSDDVLTVEALRYAWLHDLNRWAFAHNAERGRFSQSENIGAYFQAFPGVRSAERDQLAHFHARDIDKLSDGGLVACLADMIAGAIEDPLLLCGGLNVLPSRLVHPLAPGLINVSRPDVLRKLEDLAATLNIARSPGLFREKFAALFMEQVEVLLRHKSTGRTVRDWAPRMFEDIRRYKSSVMRPIIFPINNDYVSHSKTIRTLVVDRMFEEFPGEASTMLLTMTEDELIADLVGRAILAEKDVDRLRPSLDGVAAAMGVDPLVSV